MNRISKALFRRSVFHGYTCSSLPHDAVALESAVDECSRCHLFQHLAKYPVIFPIVEVLDKVSWAWELLICPFVFDADRIMPFLGFLPFIAGPGVSVSASLDTYHRDQNLRSAPLDSELESSPRLHKSAPTSLYKNLSTLIFPYISFSRHHSPNWLFSNLAKSLP